MLWMLLSAALAMASATSCDKDETAKDSFENIESTVVIPDELDGFTGTRTTIYDDGEGGIQLWWGAKEAIGVYGSGLKNAKFTGTNKYKDAASTTFSGNTFFRTPKYAYYPYGAENDANAQTAVKGNIPTSQSFNTVARRLNYDYKVGVKDSWTFSGYKFTFSNIVTFMRVLVNATGTPLEGDKLYYVRFDVTTADGQPREMSGDFTFDVTQPAASAITSWEGGENMNVASLTFSEAPVLSADKTIEGWYTAAPMLRKGDVIKFTVMTDKHVATFSRTSKADFAVNKIVKYTMTLANFDDMVVENAPGYDSVEPDEPEQPTEIDLTLKSFKFEVANNQGKILDKKLAWNSSQNKTLPTAVTEEVATIDQDNKKISLYVPYLNNRKLVPTFEVAEGAVVAVQSGEVISGQTEVDFTVNNQIAVVNPTTGDGVIYTVELTNTGLPVVVINQESGTTDSEDNADYQKASAAWYAATGAKWQPKNSDWEISDVTQDNFMVYNADGTSALSASDVPVLASTRVRGNVTQQMPKKAFAVKLDKKSGVLDMPAHKRWVLLANWKDRTLLRNEVAFGLAEVFQNTFNDGMAWNPSGQHVELVYNGVHVGNYYLCEQIKIDGNRLDIADPYDKDDAVGDPASYGYLLENDDAIEEDNPSNLMSTGTGDCWFYTKNYIPFIFKDDLDSDGSSSSTLRTYAQDFVRGVEEELYKNTTAGYSAAFAKMNLASFVDYWLVQELMMNSETAQPKSCYMNINGGILSAGPLWDFDWNTLPVSNYFEKDYSYTKSMLETAKLYHRSSGYPTTQYSSSSFFSSSTDESYLWYPMLVKSADFKNLAAQRWAQVKGALTAYANSIPAMAEKLAKSADVNDDIWFLDNKSMNSNHRGTLYGIGGSWSQSMATRGYCGDEAMTFEAAVQNLSTLLNQRISGMSYVESKTWPSKSYSSSSK